MESKAKGMGRSRGKPTDRGGAFSMHLGVGHFPSLLPSPVLFLLLFLAVLPAACSDPAAEDLQLQTTDIAAALEAGDDSAALQMARGALIDHPGDPLLLLGAAEACIGLQRFDEAADYAAKGLPAAEGDATLSADLSWAEGSAHFALYLQLQSPEDWRLANSALERGTSAAGTRRLEAIYSLVRMQGLGGMGSDSRRDKFGRLFLQLEPAGERADKVREIMGSGGSR